jgi:hypothetical protein
MSNGSKKRFPGTARGSNPPGDTLPFSCRALYRAFQARRGCRQFLLPQTTFLALGPAERDRACPRDEVR